MNTVDGADRDPLLAELAELGTDPLEDEMSDAEVLSGALAGFESGIPSVPEPASTSRTGTIAGLALGLGVAAAAAVLLVTLFPGEELGSREASSRQMAEAALQKLDAAGEAVAREARARRHQSAETPNTEPQASDARTVPIEPDPAMEAGAVRTPTPSRARATVEPTADALLQRAQRELAAGDRIAALASYRRLLRRHPGSSEGRAARVTVGRMELARGRAKQALSHFDSYLDGSGGPLREEARYGRIRALRALGRERQERASIESFLSDHSRSVYAPRLERRRAELATE